MYLLSFAALPQCFCLYPPLKNVQYASWPSSDLCFFNFIYHSSVINNEISALAAVPSTIKPHPLYIVQFSGSPQNLLINDSQLVWSRQRWDLFMNHDQQNPAEDLCKTNIDFLCLPQNYHLLLIRRSWSQRGLTLNKTKSTFSDSGRKPEFPKDMKHHPLHTSCSLLAP